MKTNRLRPGYALCLSLLLVGSSGCSTIKSWFPDKERDYQFTAEIPEIVVPDDLKAGGLSLSAPRPATAVADSAEVVADNKAQTVQAEPEVASKKPIRPEPKAVDPAKKHERAEAEAQDTVASELASPGSSLQIDQPQLKAAHIVSKALSRQKLEITERNFDKGFFYVKFDPNAVKVEDKTWLDELNFVFGDDPSQEREYRIRLRELNPQLTEVTVQDGAGKTQSSASANALLKLITEAINQDIVSPEAPNSADSNGEAKPQAQ